VDRGNGKELSAVEGDSEAVEQGSRCGRCWNRLGNPCWCRYLDVAFRSQVSVFGDGRAQDLSYLNPNHSALSTLQRKRRINHIQELEGIDSIYRIHLSRFISLSKQSTPNGPWLLRAAVPVCISHPGSARTESACIPNSLTPC
jgi:hypothetical protein